MWTLERLIDSDSPYWEVLTQHPDEQAAQEKKMLLESRIEHQRSMTGNHILAYRIRDIGNSQIDNGVRLDS